MKVSKNRLSLDTSFCKTRQDIEHVSIWTDKNADWQTTRFSVPYLVWLSCTEVSGYSLLAENFKPPGHHQASVMECNGKEVKAFIGFLDRSLKISMDSGLQNIGPRPSLSLSLSLSCQSSS